MQASLSSCTPEAAEAAVMPALDVFILYEDLPTGLRAKQSLDLLPNRLLAGAPVSTHLWKIALLADALLAGQAVLEAAAASVIILSVHGRGELPEIVRTWLRGWLARKEQRPYALGVLLDAEQAGQGSENPVVQYVQQVAEAGGADLFYGFSETPAGDLESVIAEIEDRAHRPTTVLEDILEHSEPRPCWGINE
jgi:hypothetical protein